MFPLRLRSVLLHRRCGSSALQACLSLSLVYVAVSELAGPSAGTFEPFHTPASAVLGSVTWFSTEYALYLAIAGSLWSLVRLVHPDSRRNEYLLLGCFLGLGLLAKITFIVVASPLLAVVTLARIGGFVERPRVANLAKATAMGLLIAFPWYALNARAALWYAEFCVEFCATQPAIFVTAGAYRRVRGAGGRKRVRLLPGRVGCSYLLPRPAPAHVGAGGLGSRPRRCGVGMYGFRVWRPVRAAVVTQPKRRYAAPGLILAGAALGVVAGVTSLVTRRRFFALSCCLVLCRSVSC